MLKFLTNLFATPAPSCRTQLSLTAMEDRYAPAGLAHVFECESCDGAKGKPGVVREVSPYGIGTSPSGPRLMGGGFG